MFIVTTLKTTAKLVEFKLPSVNLSYIQVILEGKKVSIVEVDHFGRWEKGCSHDNL